LTVGPLSLAAVRRLLEERLGLELTRPELARVQEATAGNPFFALELGRELVRTNTRPAPGQPLRVPESLRELLGGRLARLPGETLDVLLLVAALARPTVELVAATYGDRERVLGALVDATDEAVVELDDSNVRFAHPLLGSICYERAPVWKRRAVHRALAAEVRDVEERARHLALAADGPDETIASELDAAAVHAVARGAPSAGAELSELAAELTPGDPAAHRRRRMRAAGLHRLAGNGERAAAMFELLLGEVPAGHERADVLLGILFTEQPDTRAMIEICDEALAEVPADDARSAQILSLRSGSLLRAGEGADAALADAREAFRRAQRAGDTALVVATIGRLGIAEAWAGETTPGVLERGVELERRLGLQHTYFDSARYSLSRQLAQSGDTSGARAVLEELEREAAARGDEASRTQFIWWLSVVEWLAGRWQRALDHANAASELARQTQYAHARIWVGRGKALIETDLGLVDAARASAEEAIASSRETSSGLFELVAVGVLGRLELALGNGERAASHLRSLPEQLRGRGMRDPMLTVWADAIEASIAVGERERAHAHLETYEADAERLTCPWAAAAAARCRGLLAGAEGDLPRAFASFERALAELETYPYPLERGRTLLCLGVVRRQAQQKKAAREALEAALAIFDELGARLWAERARAELRRISGRVPASDELTETERRVARLAADGRTNREIAADLYMGVSTVEAHLSRVYRKLGVRSRTELAGRIATERDETAKTRGERAEA
jgi:DNA-binding CsgD family transcriptional regulator